MEELGGVEVVEGAEELGGDEAQVGRLEEVLAD